MLILLLLRALLFCAIVYVIWRFLSPRWAFVIVVDETGLRSHKGITTAHQKRLLDLLLNTRFSEGRVKICGRHDQHGRMILQFYGPISDDTRQQIRNYIANEM